MNLADSAKNNKTDEILARVKKAADQRTFVEIQVKFHPEMQIISWAGGTFRCIDWWEAWLGNGEAERTGYGREVREHHCQNIRCNGQRPIQR